MSYKKLKSCRNCGSKELIPVISLGKLYPPTYINPVEKLKLKKLPMDVCECGSCHLVQLSYSFNLDSSYRQYWYQSSLNKSMVTSLQDVVSDIESRINLFDKVVVDIGANDCTMLSLYGYPCTKIAFEPALNLKKVGEKKCSHFINDYFSKETYPLDKKASVVTGIAMFYDLVNVTKFVQDVKSILDENGMFIIQLTDLLSMLKNNDFINFCFEHTLYYSLQVLDSIFKNNGLQIFDCSYNLTNGGSIRVFVGFPDKYRVSKNVEKYLKEEQDYFNSFKQNPLVEMMNKVEVEKEKLMFLLKKIKEEGKTCFIVGASTKGSTLCQYYNIDSSLVQYALEINSDKLGLNMIGSNIPIISEESGLMKNPDFLLVLPWVFREFFIERFKEFTKNGGHIIFPLPELQIIGN